jgi:DNA-binding MarR family transcriptional regulator
MATDQPGRGDRPRHFRGGRRAAAVHPRLGGGVRQVTLADYVGVEGATLVRLVDQLSAAELVRREVDPSDRRANVLSLTEAASAWPKRSKWNKQLRAEVFADVSEADMAATLRVLDALSRAAAALLIGQAGVLSSMMSWPSSRDWIFSFKALSLRCWPCGSRCTWPAASVLGDGFVYIVAHPLTGATRSKALYRVLGTLLGAPLPLPWCRRWSIRRRC